MGKSARIIGREEFGLSAQEMNLLLKHHGYLYGEPGAYGLTDKGRPFGTDRIEDNGHGGSAYRQWEFATWNEDLPDALRRDMATNPDGVPPDAPTDAETDDDAEPGDPDGSDDHVDARVKAALTIGGVVIVGLLVVRFGPPLWHSRVRPAAAKVRARLTSRKRPADSDTAPAGS